MCTALVQRASEVRSKCRFLAWVTAAGVLPVRRSATTPGLPEYHPSIWDSTDSASLPRLFSFNSDNIGHLIWGVNRLAQTMTELEILIRARMAEAD